MNADGLVSTGQGFSGYNMFAYCGNNPVNRFDPYGDSFISRIALRPLTTSIITKAIIEQENRFLPDGGEIEGGWIIEPIWGSGIRTDTITYISPNQVKDLYKRTNTYSVYGISALISFLDMQYGTKATGYILLLITTLSGIHDEIEYHLLCEAIEEEAINNKGLVIITPYCNDPRSIAGRSWEFNSYYLWDNLFGKYPYAVNPYKKR